MSEVVWKEVSGRMFERIVPARKCPDSMQDYKCLHAAVVICAKPWLTHRQTYRQYLNLKINYESCTDQLDVVKNMVPHINFEFCSPSPYVYSGRKVTPTF